MLMNKEVVSKEKLVAVLKAVGHEFINRAEDFVGDPKYITSFSINVDIPVINDDVPRINIDKSYVSNEMINAMFKKEEEMAVTNIDGSR